MRSRRARTRRSRGREEAAHPVQGPRAVHPEDPGLPLTDVALRGRRHRTDDVAVADEVRARRSRRCRHRRCSRWPRAGSSSHPWSSSSPAAAAGSRPSAAAGLSIFQAAASGNIRCTPYPTVVKCRPSRLCCQAVERCSAPAARRTPATAYAVSSTTTPTSRTREVGRVVVGVHVGRAVGVTVGREVDRLGVGEVGAEPDLGRRRRRLRAVAGREVDRRARSGCPCSATAGCRRRPWPPSGRRTGCPSPSRSPCVIALAGAAPSDTASAAVARTAMRTVQRAAVRRRIRSPAVVGTAARHPRATAVRRGGPPVPPRGRVEPDAARVTKTRQATGKARASRSAPGRPSRAAPVSSELAAPQAAADHDLAGGDHGLVDEHRPPLGQPDRA